jgi:DNA/RNA endonuclease YhcR with UshA esterase domain
MRNDQVQVIHKLLRKVNKKSMKNGIVIEVTGESVWFKKKLDVRLNMSVTFVEKHEFYSYYNRFIEKLMKKVM